MYYTYECLRVYVHMRIICVYVHMRIIYNIGENYVSLKDT